jgi:hypothetical protein
MKLLRNDQRQKKLLCWLLQALKSTKRITDMRFISSLLLFVDMLSEALTYHDAGRRSTPTRPLIVWAVMLKMVILKKMAPENVCG